MRQQQAVAERVRAVRGNADGIFQRVTRHGCIGEGETGEGSGSDIASAQLSSAGRRQRAPGWRNQRDRFFSQDVTKRITALINRPVLGRQFVAIGRRIGFDGMRKCVDATIGGYFAWTGDR